MQNILNELYKMEQKSKSKSLTAFDRNFQRLYHEIEHLGFYIKIPEGEKFSEERTDVDATLMAPIHSAMKITKVLKPIIYKKEDDAAFIVQKGVVIVE